MHNAFIPRRKAVQNPCRGQIYRQDRSVTTGAPPYWNPPYVQPQRFFSFGPCTARRRGEIHSTPSPPSARTPLRSFAPPLPTKSADFVGAPVAFWRIQKEKMGESGAAPPVADAASRFRGCGTIGGPSRGRESSRRDGAAMNQPASWLAFPSPSGRVQTFPLRGKSKVFLSKKKPFPYGEKSNSPREARTPPPFGGTQSPVC